MLRFFLGRVVYSLAVLFGVTLLVFSLIHLSGDPLTGLLPPGSSPEQAASIRAEFGLNRPLPEQYLSFLGRAIQGDFGESWRQGRPALSAVLERLPRTVLLTGGAIVLASTVALTLGLASGARPGGVADGVARIVTAAGQAVPGFWLGTLLILVFAVKLQWLPSSGFAGWRSLILPAIALAVYPAAMMTRLLRGSMIETMRQEFIRTAQSKGLGEYAILRRHALRNALLPALAFAGVQIGFLLGGAVIIEGVFAYPGIGQLALTAVADRDVPLIQAFVMVVATLIVFSTMLIDLLARLLDPRFAGSPTVRTEGA